MSDFKSFQCPTCQQYINNLLANCKFCSMPISDEVLTVAVGNDDFFNNAYNAASNLRISAGVLVTSFLASFIPVVGFFIGLAHWFLLVTMPFSFLYWFVKYGSARVSNETYREAKKNTWTAFFVWLGFVLLRIVLFAAFAALIASSPTPRSRF